MKGENVRVYLISNVLLKSGAGNRNTERLDSCQSSFLEYGGGVLSISGVIWKQQKKSELSHIVSKLLCRHCTHMLPKASESKCDTKVKNTSHILASQRGKSLQGEERQ